MKILVIDDDVIDIPHMCDGFKQLRHEILHIKSVDELDQIDKFKPQSLILDLMMPCKQLPKEKCNGGYTTGASLYKDILYKRLIGVPFVVLTAAQTQTSVIQLAIQELSQYSEYRGIIEKGLTTEETIIEQLEGAA